MLLRDVDILNIDYSAAKAEYRITETHLVSELSIPFLIPYEGPMYVRNMVVRADGKILTIEKDFTIEDDFIQLELLTGKKVIGSLRILDHILKDYKQIKIVYQKVGEPIISREFLLNSADKIINDDRPIDWLTQVFAKPSSYPAAFHQHDITSKDEVIGFSDLVLLFKQATGQTKLTGLEIWDKLKAIEEKAYKTLNEYHEALWNKIFTHVMNANLPHPMTKADLGLSEHPNYGTATLVEDQNAAWYNYDQIGSDGKLILRDDKISTPKGVHSAIDSYNADTDGYVRQGTLPFSYYGSGFYLPPPISGSFEGLGTNLSTTCLCLEPNGVVTMLARGYDSKVKSLYYYYNRDIYKDAGNFVFSGVKYTHPTIEADNASLLANYQSQHGGSSEGYVPLDVNHVISGSNGEVIMIGDLDKRIYYIALSNGTLDANAHVLKRIDLSQFVDATEGDVFDAYHSSLFVAGNYVYFVAQTSRWPTTTPDDQKFGSANANYRLRIFYRTTKEDLARENSPTAHFVQQNITYQDLEGNWHYNQKTVDFVPAVKAYTADGQPWCKSMWINFEVEDPTFIQIFLSPYHCQWLCKQDPSNPDRFAVHMLHGIQYWYYGARSVGENMHAAAPFIFTVSNNTFTLDPRWFKMSYNVITGKQTVPEGKAFDAWYNYYIGYQVGRDDEISTTWIDRVGVVSVGGRLHGLPYFPTIFFKNNLPTRGQTDQWAAFNQDYAEGSNVVTTTIPMISPFGFTSVPMLLVDTWEYNGKIQDTPVEIFGAQNDAGLCEVYYRIADDVDYVKRDDLKFPYVGKDIYARAPNSRFGKVLVDGNIYPTEAAKLPAINYPVKDANSNQYGFITITSLDYNPDNPTYPYAYSELYNLSQGGSAYTTMDSEGGFYLDTLGTHVIDDNKKILTVSANTAGRVWITKAFWHGILTTLLGSNAGVAGTTGRDGTGEYVLSIFVGHPVSGSNLPVSMASVYWHTVSPDPQVAKDTRMAFMLFDWTATENNAEGFPIAKLTGTQFPDANYGGAGDGGKTIFDGLSRDTNGRWNFVTLTSVFPSTRKTVQLTGTSRDNMRVWFTCGGTHGTAGGPVTPAILYVADRADNKVQVVCDQIYYLGGIRYTYQSLYNVGLQHVVDGTVSGGSALYTERDGSSYVLVEAVFVKGNWTLFINNDLEVLFNGSTKMLKATNYSLDQLGIDPANKVFYLYAVCGKSQGYYDLSLSEKTASPYHMLVATITTNSTGINTIVPTQVFAISGFAITTGRQGGSVPATTGTFAEPGTFDAITQADLFDKNSY